MKYLSFARRFIKLAKEEFSLSRQNGDEAKIRESAEKAWGAVVQATNALLFKKGYKVPKGTKTRQDILFNLEQKDQNIKLLHLAERYGSFLQSLHSDCFYDGEISVKRIERDLRKVEEYIEAVSSL